MAIDGLNQISTEQLMAMSLMSNGQLTNDSTSSTSDETNYAFQLLMQNYLNNQEKSTGDTAQDIVNTITSGNTTSDSSVSDSSSTEQAVSDLVNMSTVKQIVQKYSEGQNLLDIPLSTNSYNITASSRISSSMDYLNSSDYNEKIYEAVSKASKKYGVDENLILAIIKQESNFDSTAVSSAGAAGLMQLMPSNVSSLGISNVYDIDQNIDGGTNILKQGLDQFNGDIELALMAYNAGAGTMANRGVTSASDLYKMPTETQNYVPKVLGYYKNGI